MKWLEKIFGKRHPDSAQIARERLQIILAHERTGRYAAKPDYLPALQRELLEVISKYVSVNQNDIKVQLEHQDHVDILEVNIVLPEQQEH